MFTSSLNVQGEVVEAESLFRQALTMREEHVEVPQGSVAESLVDVSKVMLASVSKGHGSCDAHGHCTKRTTRRGCRARGLRFVLGHNKIVDLTDLVVDIGDVSRYHPRSYERHWCLWLLAGHRTRMHSSWWESIRRDLLRSNVTTWICSLVVICTCTKGAAYRSCGALFEGVVDRGRLS